MKLRNVATAIAVLSSASAWASEAKNYDQVVPLYAEECSFTQYSRKGEAPGGTGGHEALYLKGVCYDGSQGYPRIKLCDELASANSLSDIPKAKLQDPDWGVGVSVDKDFTNVNWVAIPTKSMFLHGQPDLLVKGKEGTPVVDQIALNQTIAAALPYFQGIHGITPDESKIEKLIEDGLGTDLAVDFARKIFCERVPMGKEQLQAMVDFLNKKQDDAHEKGNVWDGANNNCAHTAHNALAATGLRHTMFDTEDVRFGGIGRIVFDAISVPLMLLTNQIATPSNDFITLSRTMTLNLHDMDPKKIYKNEEKRAAVMDSVYGSLPKELGALAELFPQVAQANNEIYVSPEDPEMDWIVMEFPPIDTIIGLIPKVGDKIAKKIDDSGIMMRHRNLKEISAADSIYRDEQARAAYFRDFYAKIEAKYLKKNPHAKDSDFTAFYERYKGLIADRITQLDAFEDGLQATAQTQAHSE